jgi:ferredoxin-thioredoxin reductase catalytic chain
MTGVRTKKTLEDVRKYVEKIAERYDWKLVNKPGVLDTLVSGLADYFNRVGYYNCPCRDTENDQKLDSDIICPCVYAREADVAEYGRCYCGLFFRKDFDTSQEIGMIPERRPQEGMR